MDMPKQMETGKKNKEKKRHKQLERPTKMHEKGNRRKHNGMKQQKLENKQMK